ncbi:MAG: M24 family metallopeptidase, partial [Chloroflexota bacterium]
ILSGGGMAFILPELEYTKLQPRMEELDVRELFLWSDTDGYEGAFEQAAEKLALRGGVLGVDDMTMRVFEWLAFSAHAPGLHVAGMGQDLLNLRAIKTAPEVDAMRRAIKLSETALEETLAQIKPGMTEREIQQMLMARLQANGSHSNAFSPIVLTGPNSGNPHGDVGDNTLEEGQFLLFDFGGTIDGYPADITRTFCLGTPTDEMTAIYNAVLRANEAARLAVKPGVTTGDIDRAAREVIEDAGYGDLFIHRTGHGLGLEVHEMPQVAAGVDTELQPGMVFTIEPGIYKADLGGVRIEDNIVVTEDGSESLTSFPRRLTIG